MEPERCEAEAKRAALGMKEAPDIEADAVLEGRLLLVTLDRLRRATLLVSVADSVVDVVEKGWGADGLGAKTPSLAGRLEKMLSLTDSSSSWTSNETSLMGRAEMVGSAASVEMDWRALKEERSERDASCEEEADAEGAADERRRRRLEVAMLETAEKEPEPDADAGAST
jgi:hypothetical protein